jgi:hypothetical protein
MRVVLSLLRPHLLAALGALLVLLAVAPAAGAQVTACPDNGPLERVFLPDFGDPALYYLAPGGSFEQRAWPGGTLVAGNEPYHVGDAGDRRSLGISGGSATSPVFCVSPEDPTIRFFARRTGGSLLSSLGVTAVVLDGDRQLRLPLVPVLQPLGGGWGVTLPTPILANVLGLPSGGTTPVQLVLTPSPGSAWQVDDVYVDPYRRH